MESSLIAELPPPLPAEQIIALNQPRADLATHRTYTWNGRDLDVPPGVFMPGATSRMIHQRILDGDIDVRGRRYAAMGSGLGVEAAVAALRGARSVHALDIHPASVAATEQTYRAIVPEPRTAEFTALVSDLFEAVPDGWQADVVTFNPPAVSQTVSDDPDVVRNVCVGASATDAFFAQIAGRDLLAPGGEVHLIASNTADLRAVVAGAEAAGFTAAVDHVHDWHDGVLTYLFRITREGAA